MYILGILGVTAIVAPVHVSPAILTSDMRWMIGTSLLLLPVLRTGWTVQRSEGVVLALAYVAYVWLLLRQ